MRKPQFLLKPSLFVLVLLLLISSIMLALSSGGFIVNFKTVGFSALSALQKGTRTVYSSVTGVVSAVQEIRVLRLPSGWKTTNTCSKAMQKFGGKMSD